MPIAPDTVLGIDGCRGGWFAVRQRAGEWSFALFPSIGALSAAHVTAARALIDIPIGLPGETARLCDTLARRQLGGRRSSIFPVPCREAVYASGYADACEANRRRLGRSLSRQSWNIAAKIAEVDTYLTGGGTLPLAESHPELCFARLKGRPLENPKSSPEGLSERLEVLSHHFAGAESLLREARDSLPRRMVRDDDVVDALVLAVAAGLPLQTLPADPPVDARGLPMAITCPVGG